MSSLPFDCWRCTGQTASGAAVTVCAIRQDCLRHIAYQQLADDSARAGRGLPVSNGEPGFHCKLEITRPRS